jgi:hypothetical protein
MKVKILSQNTWILTVLLLSAHAFFQPVKAQDTTFQVLAVDGDVSIKRAEAWLPLVAGQYVNVPDLIRLKDGAYLGMVHHTGHAMELNKPGTYEASRLSKQIGEEKLHVSAKYATLYLSMLNRNGISNSGSNLERTAQANQLSVYLPNSVDVFNDEVIIRWKDESQIADNYEVKLKNMFNEVLDSRVVNDTKTSLNFNDQKIARERMIIISVSNQAFKDQKSKDYGMKQLTPEEAEPIARELNELKLEITDQQSALDKLILASFYEQNSLLADALTSYEHAIQMAPDVEAFRAAYEQFIFRNGLGN